MDVNIFYHNKVIHRFTNGRQLIYGICIIFYQQWLKQDLKVSTHFYFETPLNVFRISKLGRRYKKKNDCTLVLHSP